MRVPVETMAAEMMRVLMKNGFPEEKAKACAKIFTENSRDGVYSHGVNRFPFFISILSKGIVNPSAEPQKIESFGAFERWDGHNGPGMLCATHGMARAIEVAGAYGIGCVALKNSNHWMRGATYGWQAAEAGCVGLCWTTALPSMPPWGGKQAKLGNNPFVFAIPREQGHVVLDIALSQFSYGKMDQYHRNKQMLPVDGGYDTDGRITKDPAKIRESGLALPIGYWKGAGLSLLIDLCSMMLSGGRNVCELGQQSDEYGVSQVFIAFDLTKLPEDHEMAQRVNQVIDDFHDCVLHEGVAQVQYPGEGTLRARKENMEKGIPVHEDIWEEIVSM